MQENLLMELDLSCKEDPKIQMRTEKIFLFLPGTAVHNVTELKYLFFK